MEENIFLHTSLLQLDHCCQWLGDTDCEILTTTSVKMKSGGFFMQEAVRSRVGVWQGKKALNTFFLYQSS